MIVPVGAGAWMAGIGFRDVRELAVGDSVDVGGVIVRGVPAVHSGYRPPLGPTGTPLGFVIRGTRSIYFAGDTDLFDDMAELGPVDVGLIPIWGWGPGLGGGHLDPERAAEAVALIGPKIVIPIHWGTYFPIHLGLTGKPGFVDLPPVAFAAALKDRAPDVELRVLRVGEETEF